MNKIAEENDPQVKIRRAALAEFTKNYIKQQHKVEEVYVIPVVFHIVHDYGPENISKAQIEDAIRVMNNDFRKLNSDTTAIITAFKNLAADCKIEFRLARIDPDGNCTEGITRTQSTLTYNADNSVKGVAPSWPRAMYLNIWVVNSIGGTAAAFAYYPGSAADGIDGILCTHSYVGSIGTSNSSTSRTLTHEIGHYLNLPHTWGSTNSPGLPDNCNSDDGISDTPNTIGHTGCDLYTETCGSLDNVQNYMEYSYCTRMYTTGQKNVMRAALNSSIGERNNLWSPANRIATGTDDAYVDQVCAPVAEFQYNTTNACTGTPIEFYDYSYNTDTIESWNWTFQGGTPAISTDQNPVVYFSNPGTFDVSLTVSNSSGSDTKTINGLITIFNSQQGINAPFFEGIENTSFPDYSDTIKSWTISGDATYQWNRTTWTSYAGEACVRVPNYLNEDGAISNLISPEILIDSLDSIKYLYFRHAYARKDLNSQDKLKISVSDDCGETWHIRYSRSAYSLSTTYQGEFYPGVFTPDSSEWRENTVDLGAYVNSGHLRIKFECTSGGGNWLYLDNIQVGDISSLGINNITKSDYEMNVFPNPCNDELSLTYSLATKSEVEISITNIIGEKIYLHKNIQNNGHYFIDLGQQAKTLDKGIYFVNLVIDGYFITRKIIKY